MNRKKINYLIIALITLVIGAIILSGYLNRHLEKKAHTKAVATDKAMLSHTSVVKNKILSAREPLPLLAIVIDDIGNSKELGEEFLKLKDITLSIIPELKYSLYFAEKGKSLGREVLVHVPMEPKNQDKYSSESEILKTGMNLHDI
jgi:polysaccharide deacetylase 2 family uncharacterized protein YibQ